MRFVSDQALGSAAQGQDDGLLDLLGLLAYASLTAFFRVSDEAALAVRLADKAALAKLAVVQFGHFQLLSQRIQELGSEPDAVMQPFVTPVDDFHALTAPSDWLEGLVKAYVGDGIAADFYRLTADVLDPANQRPGAGSSVRRRPVGIRHRQGEGSD